MEAIANSFKLSVITYMVDFYGQKAAASGKSINLLLEAFLFLRK